MSQDYDWGFAPETLETARKEMTTSVGFSLDAREVLLALHADQDLAIERGRK